MIVQFRELDSSPPRAAKLNWEVGDLVMQALVLDLPVSWCCAIIDKASNSDDSEEEREESVNSPDGGEPEEHDVPLDRRQLVDWSRRAQTDARRQ